MANPEPIRPSDYDLCNCGHHRYAHRGGPAPRVFLGTCGACECMKPVWVAVPTVAPASKNDPEAGRRFVGRVLILGPPAWALGMAGAGWVSSTIGVAWWVLPAAALVGGLLLAAAVLAAGIALGLTFLTIDRERG